jgi:diguanylate cyclase (GGDEF)-like protein
VGLAGRDGTEEFCLLLPNVDVEREGGRRAGAIVQALEMPPRTSSHKLVTVSVGVACMWPNDSQYPSDLIEAADAALYAAKHRGRNAVVEHGFVRITDVAGGIAMAS